MSTNTTPIDSTPNTPLDAIKGAYLRARDRLGDSLDGLIGARNMPEKAVEIALIENAMHDLAVLVCEQLGYGKPSRDWVPTRTAYPALYRYDAGTPVFYRVAIAPGVHMDVWPRFDTKDVLQALLAEGLDLAWPSPEQAAQRAVDEAFADTVRHITPAAPSTKGDQHA